MGPGDSGSWAHRCGGPVEVGSPRALRSDFQGGFQSFMCRRIRSMMSSCWGELIAEIIFMGCWHEAHRLGSSNQTLLMSFAQPRRRLRTNSESSSPGESGGAKGEVCPEGTRRGDGGGSAPGRVEGERSWGGGSSTGGSRSQPSFLRLVVDIAP